MTSAAHTGTRASRDSGPSRASSPGWNWFGKLMRQLGLGAGGRRAGCGVLRGGRGGDRGGAFQYFDLSADSAVLGAQLRQLPPVRAGEAAGVWGTVPPGFVLAARTAPAQRRPGAGVGGHPRREARVRRRRPPLHVTRTLRGPKPAVPLRPP